MFNYKIGVKVLLDDGAYMPTRGHRADAGLDLRTPVGFSLPSDDSVEVDTGVHLVIPEGWCGLIVAKSGLNVRNGVTVTGLVDANFTGPIRVRLYNHSGTTIDFYEGAKVAQIVFLPIPEATLELDVVLNHDGRRGDRGYGSTGR